MPPFRRWRARGRGALAFFLIALFAFCVAGGSAFAQKSKAKAAKKQATPSVTPGGSPGEPSLTDIPLPVGHDAKGVVLPDYDLEGHLRGRFIAGNARRLDQEQVAFTDLKITTFTSENETDLQIDLRTAIFNLKTKVLSSKERGIVKRTDFNITGDSLEFNTEQRTGHMTGHVKMVITSNSKLIEKDKE